MITLFRRIRQKLIDSGSVTKYLLYAIGEILLVVVGILIALQVNNWNEERNIRASEAEILQNLKVELLSNQERLYEISEKHRKEYEDGLYLLSLFGSDVSGISVSKLDSALGNVEAGYSFEAIDGYIKSLIASSKIDYIRSKELKSYISSFDAMVIDAVQENEFIQILLHDRLWPVIDGKINALNRLRTYEEYQHFPKGSYTSDYTWFFSNHEIEDLVSNIVSWKQIVVEEEQILKDNIDLMIRLIDIELEK